MAIYPSNAGELRIRTTTTFPTVYVAATHADWTTVGGAVELKPFGLDYSGLTYESVEDVSIQNRMHRKLANIATLRKGSVKFSLYLEGGPSALVPNLQVNLLSYCLGGLASPTTSKTATLAGGPHTTTTLKSAGIGAKIVIGQAVLVGTKGDGRGGGEVRVITAENVDDITIYPPLAVAPNDADVVYFSQTAYLTEQFTQTYVNGLILGEGTTPVNQMQWLGASIVPAFSNIGPDTVPQLDLVLNAADWQEVPLAERTSSTTAVGTGNVPVFNRGLGGFFFTDSSGGARNPLQVKNVNINPGISFVAIPDYNGLNGIGGWSLLRSTPTLEFDCLLEADMPGLYDDFLAKTAKNCIIQFGAINQGCCAIDMQNLFVDNAPTRIDIDGMQGVHVKCHASEPDYISSNLFSSSFRAHFI